MANFLRCLVSLLFCASSSYAAEPGEIDLAGWVKNAEGTYTKAFNDSNGTSRVTLNSPPTTLSTTSTALVNTSKGVQSFDITKSADIDVSRVGKAVRGLAVLGGPVGMAVTAVSLVCELTAICKDLAGNWSISDNSSLPGYPASLPTQGYYFVAGLAQYGAPTPNTACSNGASVHKFWGDGFTGSGSGTGGTACTVTRTSDGSTFTTTISYAAGTCPTNYTPSGSGCALTGATPHAPTESDWNSKESLLNDARFVPELNEKGIALPTSGIPTLNADQKKRLGVESEPTKDSQGNVTGRQETVTEIEAVDAGTSDKPGKVIIKETVTKIQYDNNNTQVSSNTSTSYSSQPQTENKPQTFEIKFDEVPPAELPTHNVQATFSHTSWGNGSCPPDIPVSLPYSGANLLIPTQPVCSTAEQINPFVLLLASIAGIYIVSGVRGGEK